MTVEFWFMLPIAMIISTIAMASGVEGATFFTPLFILALGLPAEVAIGVGLITEVFGFASGVISYARKKLIDYKLGLFMLMVTIPLAVGGTFLSIVVPSFILKLLLGAGLLVIAVSFLRSPSKDKVKEMDLEILQLYPEGVAERSLITASGEEIHYTVCNKVQGALFGGIGALFIGMISTGLGELNGYFFLKRCKVPSKVSVATSVFIVAVTALIASVGHAVRFARSGEETLKLVLSIVVFTIPGVIIGGQIGSLVASKIPQKLLEKVLAGLFIGVALLMIGETVFRLFTPF